MFEFSFPAPFLLPILIFNFWTFAEDEDFLADLTTDVDEFGDDFIIFPCDKILAFLTRFLETFFFTAASEDAATEVVFNEVPALDLGVDFGLGLDSFFILTTFSTSSFLSVTS